VIEWVDAHLPFTLAAVLTAVAGLLGVMAARLLSRMRGNAGLARFEVTNSILETLSRQAVRFAEEQARKLAANVKMPGDEKLYLAVEFVKQQAGLGGIDPGPDERVVAMIEGSLAAERKFLEEFDVDPGEFDPTVLDEILRGQERVERL
jgi:hypothetical protein